MVRIQPVQQRGGLRFPAGGTAGKGSDARALRLRLLVACTGALVLVGLLLAARLVAGGGPRPAPREASAPAPRTDVGRDIPTSFGVVAAESVRTLGGLGARPLAGVTHGIQNLVGPGEMQIQVLVALTNELTRPVRYGPLRFGLRVGRSGKLLPPRAASLPSGTLQPQASIEGNLVFVAPRASERVAVVLADGSRRIALDLGSVSPGRAPLDYAKHQH